LSRITTIAEFIGNQKPAFSLQFWPTEAPKANIIYLPPFGEEMNRCRSIVANQARWFARHGSSCTILDYFGTGESQGEFEDASLEIWRENIANAIQRVSEQNDAPVTLWGFRLGALIAFDYVSHQPIAPRKLLFWQPVMSGKLFLTQMLRQRTASLMQAGKEAETTEQMRSALSAGKIIEVAGYKLGGELATGIDRLTLVANSVPPATNIFWLEHCSDGSSDLNLKSSKAIAELRDKGATVEVGTFTGDPVWQLHKRADCDDLLQKTRVLSL
tara:strand:+ start:8920 stop:9735 length:816 start_codon:yes stop_codon:yes gene_type:complete